MERVIGKGYGLEELLEFFRGGMGEGEAFRNSRRFLNKRNLRRVGEIMRNANLTQSFSFYLLGFSPACPYMFPIHRDPRRPLEPCALLFRRAEPVWCVCGGGGGGVKEIPQSHLSILCVQGGQKESISPESCLRPPVGGTLIALE